MKPEERYGKLVHSAENAAKLGLFEEAYKRYLKAAESAISLNRMQEAYVWYFLASIYKCNSSIDDEKYLLSSLYNLYETYNKHPVDKVTVYMLGGAFGEFPAKRFVNEAIGLLALNNAKLTNMGLEEIVENLDKATKAFMEIGNDYLFYSKYLSIINKRVTANYAALISEANKAYLLGEYYSDIDPTKAVEHYMIASRAYRTARRMDIYRDVIKLIQGVRVTKKCWICGREIQGEKHFVYLDAKLGPYFEKLIEKNQDKHSIHGNKIVVCNVCYSAIDNIVQEEQRKLRQLIDRLLQLERTVYYMKKVLDAIQVGGTARNAFGGGY